MRLPLRHLRGLSVTGLLMLLLVAGLGTPSYGAAVAPDVPKTLSISVNLAPSGQVTVTEHHVWLVAPGKTPRLSRQLPVFSPYSPDLLKKFEYSNFTASVFETTGTTPADSEPEPDSQAETQPPLLSVLDNGANLEIQVTPGSPLNTSEAAELIEFKVELSYDVMGTLSTTGSAASAERTDEFFWSPIADSNIIYDHLELQVSAPVEAITSSCELVLPAAGATAMDTSAPDALANPKQGEPPATVPECLQTSPLAFEVTDFPLTAALTWRATFLDSTFAQTEPLVVDRPESEGSEEEQLAFDPTWTENLDIALPSNTMRFGIGIALGLVVIAGIFFLVSRSRADDRFVGTAPGEVPSDPQSHAVERAPATVVAARSTCTVAELSVAESGALMYAGLRSREVGATLISLAISGHLHITELAEESHWLLTKTAGAGPDGDTAGAPAELHPHELALWNALFAAGDQLEIVSLHANLAPTQLDVLRAVGQEVANHGLFKQPLSHESVNRQGSKHRTALGRAYLEQLIGFEEFLKEPTPSELTALSDSAGMVALFEAHLPYAVTFNCAQAWAQACDQGSHAPYEPTWFSSENQVWDATFTHVTVALNRLADTAI